MNLKISDLEKICEFTTICYPKHQMMTDYLGLCLMDAEVCRKHKDLVAHQWHKWYDSYVDYEQRPKTYNGMY